MHLQKLDAQVRKPERFIRPLGAEPHKLWARIFEIPRPRPLRARYGVRATHLDGKITYKNLITLQRGASEVSFHRTQDLLKPGVRILIAIGPENQTPVCTVYEVVE